jgi:hypothetical protein
MDRPGARELLDRVLDPGSWTSWDEPAVQPPGISEAYAASWPARGRRPASTSR